MKYPPRLSTSMPPPWIVFTVLGLVLTSCSSSGSSPITEEPTGPSAATMNVCPRPAVGCPCTDGTAPISCQLSATRAEDTGLICRKGQRLCVGGEWSSCHSVAEFKISSPTNALITDPSTCSPCDLECSSATDYPDEDDLKAHGTGLSIDSSTGGVVIEGSAGGGDLTDTDGDGIPDIVDDAPTDDTITGVEDGHYLELPFGGTAQIQPQTFDAQVKSLDVYFLVDTTGSMGGEITNLRNTLTTGTLTPGCPGGIIGSLQCEIPDSWVGVGTFADYPLATYGSSTYGDIPYVHLLDITDNFASAQTTVNGIGLNWGYDWAESQTQALYSMATGDGIGSWISDKTCTDSTRWGYPCFREDAVPVVVMIHDAPMHNGPTTSYDYDECEFYSCATTTPPDPTFTYVTGNNTQASARNVGDVTNNWYGFTGNTSFQSNSYSPGCSYSTARDAHFRFSLSSTQTVHFDLEGTSFDGILTIRDSSFNVIRCLDWWGDEEIDLNLGAGTYYVSVDGYYSYSGAYQLVVGVPPTVGPVTNPNPYPFTWAETVTALTDNAIKTVMVQSSGSVTGTSQQDSDAVGNATGSVDAAGAPFTFDISSNGTGLSTAVIDAIATLASYSRFDMSAEAVDNPSTTFDETLFVEAIQAVSFPPGRCNGIATPDTFLGCLPGTELDFNITFKNDFLTPGLLPQVYTFDINIIYNGSIIAETIPVRVVVPAIDGGYEPSGGTYSRIYNATGQCDDLPVDWSDFSFTADVPAGTELIFNFRTAPSEAALADEPWAKVTVPSATSPLDIGEIVVAAGAENIWSFVEVMIELQPNASLNLTPTLYGFEQQFYCFNEG